MELGLSLGDASNPLGISEKTQEIKRNIADKTLGFCMSLGIGSNCDEENQDEEEDGVKDDNDAVEAEKGAPVDPPFQLNLLPPTPVQSFRSNVWGAFTGSCEARGLDVNRLPTEEEEEVDGTAPGCSSSPNSNSGATSFQLDFCNSKAGGNKIDDPERACSRGSDEDDNGLTRKKLRLSKDQSAFLEESFKEHNTLNPKQKVALAKQLNLRPRQVEVWFQNRRARTKLKQTEVDCEYLKRCCETLTEENRRLHKELTELRALKKSNPFYMQLPATTLTMCPSCERVASSTANAAPAPPSSGGALTRPRFYPFAQSNQQSAAS